MHVETLRCFTSLLKLAWAKIPSKPAETPGDLHWEANMKKAQSKTSELISSSVKKTIETANKFSPSCTAMAFPNIR